MAAELLKVLDVSSDDLQNYFTFEEENDFISSASTVFSLDIT